MAVEKRKEFRDLNEMDEKLRKKITNACHRVNDVATELKTDWRTAA